MTDLSSRMGTDVIHDAREVASIVLDLERLGQEEFTGKSPAAVDAFLYPLIRELEGCYNAAGNPRVMYLAAFYLMRRVADLKIAMSSFQYSKLLAFMAKMLLVEGRNVSTLERALDHIALALEVHRRVPTWSDETMKAHVSFALHQGVIQKALGRFDESVSGMRKARGLLKTRFSVADIELVMLDRQETIMYQERAAFARMAQHATTYARHRPVEYYGTVKRVFEFAINRGLGDEARVIYPEFRRAFRAVGRRLPPLSHVSFCKNVGHFLLCDGQEQRGVDILEETLGHARALNLRGQERQISGLIASCGAVPQPVLQTFRV